jgi:nitric oxide reductase subunit B
MRRLWVAFVMVSVMGFGILGWVGSRIYQETPPIPERVLTADGSVIVPDGDIGRGQNVWQTMGGMEVGSVWGHGSYVAPDWPADWLHREAVFIPNDWARAEAGRSDLEPCSGRLARGRTAAVSPPVWDRPIHVNPPKEVKRSGPGATGLSWR